ncbi:type 2 lanthipeptide synthetase LanM family protein [Pontibacillus litoralis]|uniref:Lantibiotic biosynthesis protein dehydration domain-containing protein n=1 Tax=Pontibacillus litoralis JSM 072002 TaxID=1385512 RepID=A0A0A5FZ41_9BACI|nr:type 2 lanthipeptide synthetase LanM family protein [Pontibacillus litoralis]KGX85049.1 hypothetical protein N784_11175 [Pontibacillus litoralis JSM 072002]
MTISHLYRSLTINERISENHHPKQKVDLNAAKGFWNEILEGEDPTKIDQIFKQHYNITSGFLENHFESDVEPEFLKKSDWLSQLLQQNEFFQGTSSSSIEDSEFTNMDLSFVPFYPFFEPFLKEFYYDLFHNKMKHLNVEITYSCKNDIIKHFVDLIYTVSHKTLILEINSLRLMGKLKGDSSRERYQAFNKFLQDDDYKQSLYHEYPVLFRLISTKIVNFKRFLLELFTKYKEDELLLEKKLGIDPASMMKNIHIGSGDSHKRGKTVTILEFENGKKVVYKPRSLSIDAEFQRFISWINESGSTDNKLKTTEILDLGDYGWSEFIPYQNCNTTMEVSNFYNRTGQLLGILHVMNATDFHYENIISNGEHPVLIDLESLFHHTVSSNHEATKSKVVNKSLQLINDSVLSTGLIPNSALKDQDDSNIDLSGIGNSLGNKELPFKTEVVSNQYTDEVMIEKRHGTLSPGLNTPQIKGVSLQIGDYLEDIIDGFSSIYNFFLTNKTELVSRIKSFKGKETRKIFRDTMKYGKLLNLSYHPDFMRNQVDREVLLNRLRAKQEEAINRVVDYEIEDMLEGDIPYFSSTPEGKGIMSSNHSSIDNFYYKDGLTLSLEKIARLSQEDHESQLNIIAATISAVYSETDIKLLHFKEVNHHPGNSEGLIKRAEEIAEILLDSAIKNEDEDGLELCWTSMVTKGGNENTWVYSITGPGLYDGNPGIALYFSYLWKLTGNPRYKQAAYATLNPIIKMLPDLVEPENVNLGGYLGIGGIVYSLHHLGEVLQDDGLKEAAKQNAVLFDKFIAQDKVYDLIGGSAGALMILMNLYEEYKEDWMLQISRKLVNHLIENSQPQNVGVAWVPHNDADKDPYIGFSHGNAGIIAALSRYFRYRPSDQLEEIIQNGINYENTFFNAEKGNWFSTHLDKYLLAWCHGGPGILLSRCILHESGIENDELSRDIEAAYNSGMLSKTGKNYSLCHGDMGLIDILMVAEVKMDGYKKQKVSALREQIIQEVFSNSQIQADINSVGLLNGIASIGYGLLRLASPNQVPSVLILEKPNTQ